MKSSTWNSILGGVSLFTFASAASSTTSPSATTNPCAKISSIASSVLAADPKALPTFVPSDVLACQKDTPLNTTLATAQVQSLKNFLQFQSTLAFLKDPPSTYDLPAVDVMAELDMINVKVSQSVYQDQSEMDEALYDIFKRASDGHLTVVPCSIGAYSSATGVDLISISTDGVELPKIYMLDEAQSALQNNRRPSPLTAIDGIDIETYLAGLASYLPVQDLDAKYNFLLYNPATKAPNTLAAASGSLFSKTPRFFLHNDTTQYTFANGTTTEKPNGALPNIEIDFDSGEAFYDKHIMGQCVKPQSPEDSAPVTAIPDYPTPFIIQQEGFMSGYFPTEEGMNDAAVISVPSFDASTPESLSNFQNSVRDFLEACREKGKSRLLIDVRANGGGQLALGKDLFRQLFPSLIPQSQIRWRVTDAANFLGEQISQIPTLTPDQINKTALSDAFSSAFRAEDVIDPATGQPFTSWAALAPPVESHGDNFTKLVTWDLNNTVLNTVQGITITGYGAPTVLPSAAFPQENVTILTDGHCDSTCADFVRTLVAQTKVKSIVAGGRPNNRPMALIGGTQGTEVVNFKQLSEYAKVALKIAGDNQTVASQPGYSDVKGLTSALPMAMFGGPEALHVNIRDSIAAGDQSMTPQQFTKQYADCRMFYTASDIENVTNTWQRVFAGVQKNGEGLCINGTVSKWAVGTNGSSTVPYTGTATGSTTHVGSLVVTLALALTMLFL
ncbi:hypothetical protein B9Z65_9184 [Elsinoe australis]|uniref:CPAF-like PDZ domain-containing protein n=1 Tax=Elsinoe australis TaxID=40998 RepID=A0A2P7Z0R7_9PEZI|nr:hypothetical protein B9Z65_9184 [Elsinoe australis]